jgi:hypothetical protein
MLGGHSQEGTSRHRADDWRWRADIARRFAAEKRAPQQGCGDSSYGRMDVLAAVANIAFGTDVKAGGAARNTTQPTRRSGAL